ncbi:hydroxyethylthiazole kinase [Bifidobacterium myosotis]|uniref:Hydroxyethylthiazole kinase n=1 Tax=Bifidobacterium myosotis TaxID=1630166 RepID=A0A5M9ZIK4_9BIFI|nr:hydroxyethylthiazole kinase [Bifidobacterium myosotis]KAA8827289.1 hydroxyethylthiazole kinase [Bifidobacterium myosotis]
MSDDSHASCCTDAHGANGHDHDEHGHCVDCHCENAGNAGNASNSNIATASAHADDDELASLRHGIAQAVRDVKAKTPLAQSFTNFVTINLVANAQLAAGGTAAMSFLPDDVIDTASISGADYINVGTLLPFYADALPQIARAFRKSGHPWVLDPVAAGIGRTRTEILRAFRATPPTIVRGNASEIIALADMWGLNQSDGNNPETRPAGVESVDEVDAAVEPAKRLARFLAASAPAGKAAVAVSGAVDLVTDGEQVYRLPGGSALMSKITGAGCSLGGVTATYLAVAEPLTAALAATLLYNRAGEIAEAKADGPGSFQVHLLDALWNLTPEQVAESAIAVQ